MKFSIYSAQKTKEKSILELEAEYVKRLKGSNPIEFIEYSNTSALFSQNKNNTFVVILDETGVNWTSTQLAHELERLACDGKSQVQFVIGGPEGFDDSTKKKGDLCLSLSKLTFTYQMTRLILVEQIYRAVMINRGTPYHK